MANPVLESPTNPHFFQPLLPGFDSYLTIPVKFLSVYLEGKKVGKTVELRSDASEISWKVEMEGRKVTVGWKEFATAHDLRVGDVIVFRHDGASVFHVTCFGPSCCGIQYVQSCDHDDNLDDDQENIRNLSMKQSLETEPASSLDEDKDYMGKLPRKKHVKKRIPEAKAKSFSSDPSCFDARVSVSNLKEDTKFLLKRFSGSLTEGSIQIVLMDEGMVEGVKTCTLVLKFRNSTGTFYMRDGWRSFCYENELKPDDTVTFKLVSKNKKTPLLRFSTAELKRVSTKDCNKRKRNKSGDSSSQKVPSSPSSVSAPTSVSEGRFVRLTVTPASLRECRLHLTVNFIKVNGMENLGRKNITLLDKDKRDGEGWPVTLVIENRNTRLGGLKDFFKAKGIKACDSFVLELVWEDKQTLPMFKFCSKIKT